MSFPERRFTEQSAARVVLEERADGPPRIVGYASVFFDGSPDTQYELWEGAVERIMPGAFARAIEEDDSRALFNHEPDNLLGRTSADTLSLSEDKRGLRYEIIPPDTTIGRDVTEMVRRGDLQGSSFAFTTTDEEWRKEDGVMIRELRGVKLYDVGPVTYPAYEGTTTGLRAAGSDEARASFEAWQKKQAALQDELRARDVRIAELRA